MAPAYKLTYFNGTALAEPIRFLLSYGGIEFEDVRVSRDVWPKLKPNQPFGQIPVLEYKGNVYHQSNAICRYVAKQVKLVGSNDLEDLEIDSMVDTLNDLRAKIALYWYESDPAIKESRKGPLFNETIPFYMERLEKIVKKNNGHFACGKLTWADLWFVAMLDYLNLMAGSNLIEKYDNLKGLKAKVLEIPAIKAWVEKRPVGDF